ncbi:outer membrane lipoprotein carrier protein LolA [Deferribacterales bacterium Es71-Z0220]|uniref:LolA family protein n=1 Tax=Deferrivibrio essentukiensis TaxID=2880922 RepID=UPI001F608E65|nr:outer membrane lipoprotein carrier protein LolA [Deferrivibrio essentukiensis]MCB4203415.1 outer membrane lipoprotein carrier protein LolA [Deferrivibrio essentukiensis]
MRIFYFFMIFVFSSSLFAENIDTLINKFTSIKSLKADFYQETTIKDFGTDAYTGVIKLLSNSKVIWDYKSPYPQYYLFTKDSMEYYDSSTEQLIRQKVTSSGSNNIIFQILLDLKESKNTFNFEAVSDNVVKLIPKTDIGLKYLLIEFSDEYIKKITSEDNNGNLTTVTFTNVQINVKLDGSEFKKEVPLNTEIFNY